MGSNDRAGSSGPKLGVLTRTVIRSPVIRWILHARIRHRRYNDVVFVGDDFIHVKQVKREGHLEHVVTKANFSAHIRAAKTFSNDFDSPDNDGFIKGESEDAFFAKASEPPQFLVLTLSSDDLVFLYLKEDSEGNVEFVQQTLPMPTFDRTLYQTGEHLAVDPHSRALAVAANEREVIIYSARKSKKRMQDELQAGFSDWCPVSAQRPMVVSGVIQNMEFLIPDDNDPDHVILLLIVLDQRKTKALWIEWYYSTDLHHAQSHPGQAIDTMKTVPSLLIPLIGAAFLLVTGDQMKMCKNIVAGSPTLMAVDAPTHDTPFPGGFSRQPVWTGWCRPRRNRSLRQEKDVLYLMREDGLVFLFEVIASGMTVISIAGDAGCHAGMAFASLGDDRDPDILAFVGDQSNGHVVKIGHWATAGRIVELSRLDTMEMQRVEALPNWASCTDMVVSTLPHSSGKTARSRDAVLVTSGRQPHGTVTELRKGLEARLSVYIPFHDLRSVIGAYVLPDIPTGAVIIMLTTLASTRLIHFNPDNEELDELENESNLVLELAQPTLAADVLCDGYLLQITERSICAGAHLHASFEDRSRYDCDEGHSITTAAIEPHLALAIVVERCNTHTDLRAFKHHAENGVSSDEALEEGLQQVGKAITADADVLSLATIIHEDGLIGVISRTDGLLQIFTRSNAAAADIILLDTLRLPTSQEKLCDQIILLKPMPHSQAVAVKFLAVCGLRDGTIFTATIEMGSGPSFGGSHELDFSQSTVTLTRHTSDIDRAYARNGLDLCILSWDGTSADSLLIQSLWVSDKARPELSQGAVLAISKMPSSDHLAILDMADMSVIISNDEVWITSIDPTPTAIPRQISVEGTPNRLIYAERHRSIICASVCTNARTFPSDMPHAKPEERRQIWPAINVIPADRSEKAFTFHMQPGEKVFALLEWTMVREDGKRYSFIMTGGSYTSRSGTVKGRVGFLQPVVNKSWETVNITEGRPTSFDAPVYALALFDDMTYIACSGSRVIISRFSTTEMKWNVVCEPCNLASPGVSIEVTGPLIHVSTQEEALVTLRLEKTIFNGEGSYGLKLVLVAKSPRVDQSLSHAIISLPAAPDSNAPNRSLALLSTKDGRLVGTTSPSSVASPSSGQPHRASLLFDAELPISLTRVRTCDIRPHWRKPVPEGVIVDNIIGVATDGTLMGISLLSPDLWRRLFWLQRLCEWDEKLSPHSLERPNYSIDEESLGGRERAFPVGLAEDADEEMLMSAGDQGQGWETHMHINGDVLSRVIEHGGKETLKTTIRESAKREDRAGKWVKEHLDEELEAVEEIVDELEAILSSWL